MFKGPLRGSSGSVLVAMMFTLMALTLTVIVIGAAVGGNINSRNLAAKEQQRATLSNALQSFQSTMTDGDVYTGGWRSFQVPTAGRCDTILPRDSEFVTVSTFQICTKPEQLTGDEPFEGYTMTIKVTTPKAATRYYKAHVKARHGFRVPGGGASDDTAGKSDANRLWLPVETGATRAAGDLGFTSANGPMIVATNGGTLNSYSTTSGTTAAGAPLRYGGSLVLGAANAGKTFAYQAIPYSQWLFSTTGSESLQEGTGCAGAGCAGSTISPVPASLGPQYASTGQFSVAATSPCREYVWIASEHGGSLSVPATHCTFSSMIFDVNTTISGSGSIFIMSDLYGESTGAPYYTINGAVRSLVDVKPGVSVNVSGSTKPNTVNTPPIISTLGGLTKFNMGVGAKFGGRVIVDACSLEDATFYGSLSCAQGLTADKSDLWWQSDLQSQTAWWSTTFVLVKDINLNNFKEVKAVEAGY